MVRLVYESLADYLVRKRNYDGLLLDDFTTDEMQLLSRHQIVDFDNLNVKLSFSKLVKIASFFLVDHIGDVLLEIFHRYFLSPKIGTGILCPMLTFGLGLDEN